jgi:signal transduction histidine kinase
MTDETLPGAARRGRGLPPGADLPSEPTPPGGTPSSSAAAGAPGGPVGADTVVDLVVCEGDLIGRRFRVAPGTTIGRATDADIQLHDRRASRFHARLEATEDGRLAIRDLESHNGLFVNRERVTLQPLCAGDIVRIGETPLAVHVRSTVREADPRTLVESIGQGCRVSDVLSEAQLAVPSIAEVSTDEFLRALDIPDGVPADAATPAGLRRLLARTRQFAVVYGICKELGTASTLEALLRRALESLRTVTGATQAHIVLFQVDSREIESVVSAGPGGVGESGPRGVSRTMVEWVARHRAAVLTSDASADGRFRSGASVSALNLGSLLGAPLVNDGAVLGVVALDRERQFQREDLRMVSVLAPVLALAIRNARLAGEQRRALRELGQAHRELVLAQEALVARERMAVLGRFAEGMAHEIRNALMPLAALADVAEALPAESGLDEDVALMLDAVDRLQLLVRDIRALAQGERATLRLAVADLALTIDAVCAISRCDPSVRRHQLVVETAPVAPFPFDETRLKQALVNLVHDRARSMEHSGRLTLRARPDPQSPDGVLIEVADEGPALSSDEIAALWTGAPDVLGASPGTGLGLDVARRIVESHGGTLSCRSVPGAGTTLTVHLRRQPPAATV